MQQQEMNLSRVRAQLGDAIERFCRERLASGRAKFRAEELRAHVASLGPSAPASADRVLRALRQDGRVAYQVIDRRASLYEVLDPEQARRVA